MDEKPETSSEPLKHKSYLFPVYVLLVVILGSVTGWYLYHSQRSQVDSVTSKNASLSSQLTALKDKLNSAKNAGNITTASWKTYCDPHGIFCFKYPPGWVVNQNYNMYIGESATLTNPAKTLSVTYQDGYLKDDFPANFIVHSINGLNVSGNDLAVLGGYYVEAVEHTPQYSIVSIKKNANDLMFEPILSDKPGQNIYSGAVPIFQYGTTGLGEFLVRPTNKQFLATQQADAWFNSIDGKTAYLIASSLYEQ